MPERLISGHLIIRRARRSVPRGLGPDIGDCGRRLAHPRGGGYHGGVSSSWLPESASRTLAAVRTRLWSQAQFPDPELLFREGGTFMLGAYLQQCWSPDLTKEILTQFGADIHPETWPVGPNVIIHEPGPDFSNLSIGSFSHIGRQVLLDLTDRILIEDAVSVGMRASILTHLNLGEYPQKPMAQLIKKKQKPTILRRGCSVGANAVVLCGVEIGEDAVVNAGVVVDRDVPPRTVVNNTRRKDDYPVPDRFFEKLARKARTLSSS